MELNEFLDLKDYTLSIDWSSIENDIGFQLHDDLKKLYSRAYAMWYKQYYNRFPHVGYGQMFSSCANEKTLLIDYWGE